MRLQQTNVQRSTLILSQPPQADSVAQPHQLTMSLDAMQPSLTPVSLWLFQLLQAVQPSSPLLSDATSNRCSTLLVQDSYYLKPRKLTMSLRQCNQA